MCHLNGVKWRFKIKIDIWILERHGVVPIGWKYVVDVLVAVVFNDKFLIVT